eukprot:Nk52_evm23s1401 gene=Nk52_evmTU23s1401
MLLDSSNKENRRSDAPYHEFLESSFSTSEVTAAENGLEKDLRLAAELGTYLLGKVNKLEEDLSIERRKREFEEKKAEDLEVRLKKALSAQNKVSSENRHYDNVLLEREERMNQLRKANEKMAKRLDKEKEFSAAHLEECKRLQELLDTSKAALEEERKRRSVVKRQLDQAKREVEFKCSENTNLQKEINKLTKGNIGTSPMKVSPDPIVQALEEENTELFGEIKFLKDQVRETREKCEDVERERDEYKTLYDEQTKNLEEELKTKNSPAKFNLNQSVLSLSEEIQNTPLRKPALSVRKQMKTSDNTKLIEEEGAFDMPTPVFEFETIGVAQSPKLFSSIVASTPTAETKLKSVRTLSRSATSPYKKEISSAFGKAVNEVAKNVKEAKVSLVNSSPQSFVPVTSATLISACTPTRKQFMNKRRNTISYHSVKRKERPEESPSFGIVASRKKMFEMSCDSAAFSKDISSEKEGTDLGKTLRTLQNLRTRVIMENDSKYKSLERLSRSLNSSPIPDVDACLQIQGGSQVRKSAFKVEKENFAMVKTPELKPRPFENVLEGLPKGNRSLHEHQGGDEVEAEACVHTTSSIGENNVDGEVSSTTCSLQVGQGFLSQHRNMETQRVVLNDEVSLPKMNGAEIEPNACKNDCGLLTPREEIGASSDTPQENTGLNTNPISSLITENSESYSGASELGMSRKTISEAVEQKINTCKGNGSKEQIESDSVTEIRESECEKVEEEVDIRERRETLQCPVSKMNLSNEVLGEEKDTCQQSFFFKGTHCKISQKDPTAQSIHTQTERDLSLRAMDSNSDIVDYLSNGDWINIVKVGSGGCKAKATQRVFGKLNVSKHTMVWSKKKDSDKFKGGSILRYSILESSALGEFAYGLQILVTMIADLKDDDIKLEEVFENQRSGLIGKFSTKWLMLTERGPSSTIDGKPCPTKEEIRPLNNYQWTGEWKIDYGRNVDAEGWEYAVNWNANSWFPEKKTFTYVRRRRWFREQRRYKSEEKTGGSASPRAIPSPSPTKDSSNLDLSGNEDILKLVSNGNSGDRNSMPVFSTPSRSTRISVEERAQKCLSWQPELLSDNKPTRHVRRRSKSQDIKIENDQVKELDGPFSVLNDISGGISSVNRSEEDYGSSSLATSHNEMNNPLFNDTDLSLGEIRGANGANATSDGGKLRSSTLDSNDSVLEFTVDRGKGAQEETIRALQAKIERIQQKYHDLKDELAQSKTIYNEEKKALLTKASAATDALKKCQDDLKEKSLLLVQKNGELTSLRAHYANLRKRLSSDGQQLSNAEGPGGGKENAEGKQDSAPGDKGESSTNSKGSKMTTVECEDVVYENQRSLLVGGFSVKYLIPKVDSRGEWSDVNGKPTAAPDSYELPDPSWTWVTDWDVELNDKVDAEGWTYAYGFGSDKWYAGAQKSTFVRRRKWARVRKQMSSPEVNRKLSLAHSLSTHSYTSMSRRGSALRQQTLSEEMEYSWMHVIVMASLTAVVLAQLYLWARLGGLLDGRDIRSPKVPKEWI